jgi:galactokinase
MSPEPARREVHELISRLGQRSDFDRSEAFLVRVPLRICPIGAHVDHQGGIVTGMTIDRFVFLVAVPDSAPMFSLESLDFPGEVDVDLTGQVPPKSGDWGDYVRAAVSALGRDWPLGTGIRAVIGGDLPGAGLSSSAAVLIAYLLALTWVNGIDLGREGVSALVQRAENDYVGVESGRLDQSIILFAERGMLTRVACSDHIIDQVPSGASAKEFEVLVAFSGVTRALARSDFNTRVEQCRKAAKILSDLSGSTLTRSPVLSEISPEIFEQFAADLPTIPRRRAAHYFGEQRRVLKGVEAWRQGDIERFGSLVTASGASSIQNYECGTAELITLYELLRDTPGVFGTRFSGGGFGGSCIALVEREAGERVIQSVKEGYESAHPEAAAAAAYHLCRPEGPARVEELRG